MILFYQKIQDVHRQLLSRFLLLTRKWVSGNNNCGANTSKGILLGILMKIKHICSQTDVIFDILYKSVNMKLPVRYTVPDIAQVKDLIRQSQDMTAILDYSIVLVKEFQNYHAVHDLALQTINNSDVQLFKIIDTTLNSTSFMLLGFMMFVSYYTSQFKDFVLTMEDLKSNDIRNFLIDKMKKADIVVDTCYINHVHSAHSFYKTHMF